MSGTRAERKDREVGTPHRSVYVCRPSKSTRGGLFYSPSDKKVFVSTNATFLKDDYMTNFKPHNKVVLEELRSDQIRKSPSTTDERQSQETTIPIQNIPVPRYSGRVVTLPSRYGHEGEVQFLVSVTNQDDPLTYSDAMDDSEKTKKWNPCTLTLSGNL